MVEGSDYIGVGVGALVFNHHQEVFLAQRGSEARNERGCWEFPGGSVRFGEKLVDAVIREFHEEFAMQIEVRDLLSVFDHILLEEQQHWISVTFLAVHIEGVPKIVEPSKCSAFGWFLLHKLPKPLSMVTISNLDFYYAKYGRDIVF